MLFPYYEERYRNLRTVFLGAEGGQVTGEAANVGIDNTACPGGEIAPQTLFFPILPFSREEKSLRFAAEENRSEIAISFLVIRK